MAIVKVFGFGGLEILIAVVLLGIIFLMTLKGAALVESIRALMMSYQIEHFQNRVMVYQAEYSWLPGDDPNAPRRYQRSGATRLIFQRAGF